MQVRAFERFIPWSKILYSFQVKTSLDLITTKTVLVMIPQKAILFFKSFSQNMDIFGKNAKKKITEKQRPIG